MWCLFISLVGDSDWVHLRRLNSFCIITFLLSSAVLLLSSRETTVSKHNIRTKLRLEMILILSQLNEWLFSNTLCSFLGCMQQQGLPTEADTHCYPALSADYGVKKTNTQFPPPGDQ